MNTREAVAQESSLTTRLGALLAAAVLATVGVSLTGCNPTDGKGRPTHTQGNSPC